MTLALYILRQTLQQEGSPLFGPGLLARRLVGSLVFLLSFHFLLLLFETFLNVRSDALAFLFTERTGLGECSADGKGL